MNPALAATLRRLAAHLDEADLSRPLSRRAGRAQSPYACDFEIDEAELAADLMHAIAGLKSIQADGRPDLPH